ncbi:MAG: exodeoxyribonuclease VII small subunit [Rhodospirillaceae bacterium]|nr:exodeoxyribonuclease VII small subunit [Rhodospirillaceae bacterium]
MSEASIPPEIARLSFEEALEELQGLVKTLEKGESKLEEAIQAYERGDALRRHCEAKLRDAQMKVERIVHGPDGRPSTEPATFD